MPEEGQALTGEVAEEATADSEPESETATEEVEPEAGGQLGVDGESVARAGSEDESDKPLPLWRQNEIIAERNLLRQLVGATTAERDETPAKPETPAEPTGRIELAEPPSFESEGERVLFANMQTLVEVLNSALDKNERLLAAVGNLAQKDQMQTATQQAMSDFHETVSEIEGTIGSKLTQAQKTTLFQEAAKLGTAHPERDVAAVTHAAWLKISSKASKDPKLAQIGQAKAGLSGAPGSSTAPRAGAVAAGAKMDLRESIEKAAREHGVKQ